VIDMKSLLMFCVVMTLSACALDPAARARADEEVVSKRAMERWNLLIEGRLESAYNYLSSGYKAVTPYSHYQKTVKGQGLWKAATVENVQCEAESCEVKVKLELEIHYPLMKNAVHTDSVVIERWVKSQNGVWGFVPTS
jgi:hypothetical protein